MSSKPISTVILAAGKGTRMYSDLPKVLHTLAGKPMVQHVIDACKKLNASKINLIYGHGADLLQRTLTDPALNWILQSPQLGTGHAVQQAIPFMDDQEDILILYGDVPLISAATLQSLCAARPKHGIALLTVELENPQGYGRIVREQGEIIGIVEQKDAQPQQLNIKEVNTGMLVANGADLKRWLSRLNNNNAQGEFYLTDIIGLASQEDRQIKAVQPACHSETEGVNTRQQLANLEFIYQRQQAQRLLLAGVMLRDPARFDLRGELEHGRDVEIDNNVILEGRVVLGNNVKIGAGCIIRNSFIGDQCEISPYTVIDNAILQHQCTVGPFARLRPGSELSRGVHVGNFVEIKQSVLGEGTKAGHLSYLGNASIGSGVNIGAGSITCNYDGQNKSSTEIGNNVFVGSATQFVAPVSVADNVTIAAGTTILNNVTGEALVYNRKQQIEKADWVRPVKKKG